jgi:hypothetical protein
MIVASGLVLGVVLYIKCFLRRRSVLSEEEMEEFMNGTIEREGSATAIHAVYQQLPYNTEKEIQNYEFLIGI